MSERTVKRITEDGNKSSSESQTAGPSFSLTRQRRTKEQNMQLKLTTLMQISFVFFMTKRDYPTSSQILADYEKITE